MVCPPRMAASKENFRFRSGEAMYLLKVGELSCSFKLFLSLVFAFLAGLF